MAPGVSFGTSYPLGDTHTGMPSRMHIRPRLTIHGSSSFVPLW